MTSADRRQRVITSTPHLTPDEVATRSFGTKVRGYAESEVRAFLKRVSEEMAAAREREHELGNAIDSLEEQLRQPRPLSEQELLDSLGEETARLLRSARAAADDIRAKAEERAAALVEEATTRAERARADAEAVLERRTEEAEERVAQLLGDAEARVQDLRDNATGEAEAIVEGARKLGREMLDEAKAARERVLGDLVRRRALLQAQIEELRGGRDRLLDAYRTVKRTFLEATEALAQVEARAVAELSSAPAEPVDVDAEVAAEIEALEAGAPADIADQQTVLVDLHTADEVADLDQSERVEVVGAEHDTDDGQSTRALADVESLFARIRAGHTEEPNGAEVAAQESGDEPVIAVAEPPAESVVVVAEEQAEVAQAPEEAPAGMTAAAWRDARERVLEPLVGPLLKRAKRTAQDDQNALLDAVRRHKGRPNAAQVLPDLDALLASWSAVLREAANTAYAAGREAAGADAIPADDALLREAADAIVSPLRLRVTVAIDSGEAGDTGGLVERIGARYREWKNQSLEGALAEALAFVWSRGVYDGVPDGSVLWWVPFEEGSCPDCDDNGLEPTVKGEQVPTGQVFPPAHPGCRCLLAPANVLIARTATQ